MNPEDLTPLTRPSGPALDAAAALARKHLAGGPHPVLELGEVERLRARVEDLEAERTRLAGIAASRGVALDHARTLLRDLEDALAADSPVTVRLARDAYLRSRDYLKATR